MTAATSQIFNGYLFSKLAAIGSRSEGPEYFLQGFDYSETPIKKHVELFEDDPQLRALLATKVAVTGSMIGKVLAYSSIGKYAPAGHVAVG